MCRRVTCSSCGKPTWSGCGQHVEQALAGVPQTDRCQGHDDEPRPEGFLARVLGR
jgi:hypothetical protein